MPTMMIGSAAIFIDCDKCWKLLLITRKGSIYVWDLLNRTCLLHDSLAPLVPFRHDSSTEVAGMNKWWFIALVCFNMTGFIFQLFSCKSLLCWSKRLFYFLLPLLQVQLK